MNLLDLCVEQEGHSFSISSQIATGAVTTGGDLLPSKSKMTELGKSSFEEVSSTERSLGHLTLATSMEGQEAMERHRAETRTGLWPITSDESSGMKSMGETCDMCSCLKHLAAALTANISQKNLHTFEMERCTEARIGGLRGGPP